MKRNIYIDSTDGKSKLHLSLWDPETKPVAILQIVHGMAEYVDRYENFAQYLCKRNILVVGNDHIGHGQSANPEDYGYFGESDGWQHFIDDVEKVRIEVDKVYPNTPHYILGHSMGSFITRCYLAKYGNVKKAIIMGTAGANPSVGMALNMVAFLRRRHGDRYKSQMITALAFGSYNKKIKNPISPTAWITRDLDIVRKYDEDPASGFTFTLAGYADLFRLLKYMSQDECYQKAPKDVPLFICAGSSDPVGNYGQGPTEVAEKYKVLRGAGDGEVTLKLYPNMLHEVLNEFGKEEVMNDCYQFLVKEN